jgi:hypothetical protein
MLRAFLRSGCVPIASLFNQLSFLEAKMAFVNEYIAEADYEKYDLRDICGKHNKAHHGCMHSRSWTIDRERNVFLIKTWAHQEATETGWAFYWHGEWIFFEATIKDVQVNKIADSCWALHYIKKFVVPETLKAQQEQLIEDFRAAWSAYGAAGVLSKFTNRSATIEFIEE